jgi:hypothetical protein
MADVASIAQGAQIGVENTGTPGTLVPANKLLNSISITDGPEGTNETFRPDGHKYAALTIPGKEWTTADFTGKLTYDDFAYILCSLIRSVTPSTTGGLKKWVVAPQNAAEDTHQTYSIEKGGVVRAHNLAYGIFDSLVIDISRDAADISGTLFGQRITDGATLTSTPTAVPLTPVLPRLFDVSLDTTAAALGNTKLLRAFTGRVNLGNLVGPIWPIDVGRARRGGSRVPDAPALGRHALHAPQGRGRHGCRHAAGNLPLPARSCRQGEDHRQAFRPRGRLRLGADPRHRERRYLGQAVRVHAPEHPRGALMGLTIARLAAETRTFTWKCLGEEVPITYKPSALTHAWLADFPNVALAACVISLDILNGNGKPIKLDAETLGQTLSVHILREINQAIWDDSAVDPTTAETSGAS